MATRTLARGSRLSGSTIPVEVPADARTVRLRLDADFDAIAQKRSQDQTFIVRIDLAVSRDAGRSWRSSLSVTKHDATLIPDDARGGEAWCGLSTDARPIRGYLVRGDVTVRGDALEPADVGLTLEIA